MVARKKPQPLLRENLLVMVPFCRSPDEADRVLKVMAENGLARGECGE